MQDFHPLIAEWFRGRFAAATPPQREAWPRIRAGRDVLVSAPTGSGKTLAAFLICLDRLVAVGLEGRLDDRIDVVYVSPLKALSNDIGKNLETPLAEIETMAASQGLPNPGVRTAVRTGDTSAWERERMIRRPPHILVTTPESLFILLTAERGREALRRTSTVIVDEIHALVDDKRGSHLALTLARLEDLVLTAGGARPQRIGLSATVRPIEDVASFLHGSGTEEPLKPEARSLKPTIAVIDSGHRRQLDLAVEVPRDELGVVASNEMWVEIYDRLSELVLAHRTTLVFVNTRRLCERVAHHLAERLGDEAVLAHHGSLSRRLRQTAESQLKAGRLRAVVATASLELGIDIGTVDLVCQIGSPRSIAVTLQRVGRSGHQVDTPDDPHVPTGRLFATTRDELVECAALVRAIRKGRLDRLAIPVWPVDVLAQQLVAACACETWRVDDLFDLVRRAAPYATLPRAAFDAVVDMLADGITTSRGRRGAYLHHDRVNGTLRGRRGARLAAITGGGAIPDNANYLVVAEPDQTTVGTVDEDFAVESMSGDIFLLGTTSWRIRRVESGRLRVEDARGAAPSLPFWRGEAPGRTSELSEEVSRLRDEIAEALSPAPETGPSIDGETRALEVLTEGCGLDLAGAEQVVAYVRAGVAALGALPTERCVVAERFFDEAGGMQLIVHAPFGARVNRAWGLALRKRFCRSFNFELQAAATDNGIVISLAEQHSFPLEAIFQFLTVETVAAVLTQAMLPSPMFGARWRWNASRALAVLRFAGGRKVPPPIQRMRSDDLLASVFPDQVACQENLTGDIRIPDHPLVNETIRDCLHEAMDLDGLRAVLAGIERGEIRTHAIDTAEPSPFCHEILNANPYAFLDDAPLEERRARAEVADRSIEEELIGGRYRWIEEHTGKVMQEPAQPRRGRSERIDGLLLHPAAGFALFLLAMGIVFQSLFSGADPAIAA
ncbi:MAG: DEAD/DEAH box helicase, partial [Vicinamibacterales bacterium]|nr:DEAD/DEAH box helicase [Vicinamibacterales bacterium]